MPCLAPCLPACLQREDLAAIVAGYLSGVVAGAPVAALVDFYLAAKAEAVRGAAPCSSYPSGVNVSWTASNACRVASQG